MLYKYVYTLRDYLKEFMTSEVTGMGNHIYTIGRELGSGGYTVAKLLAERLESGYMIKSFWHRQRKILAFVKKFSKIMMSVQPIVFCIPW